MQAWSVWPVGLWPLASVAAATVPHCQGVSAAPVGDGLTVGDADGVTVADGDGVAVAGGPDVRAVGDAVTPVPPGDGCAVPVCPGGVPGCVLGDTGGPVARGCEPAAPGSRPRVAACPAGVSRSVTVTPGAAPVREGPVGRLSASAMTPAMAATAIAPNTQPRRDRWRRRNARDVTVTGSSADAAGSVVALPGFPAGPVAPRGSQAGPPSGPITAPGSVRSARSSPAASGRRRGSLSRQAAISRHEESGMPCGRSGVRYRWPCMIAAAWPLNGVSPASSSYRVTPTA